MKLEKKICVVTGGLSGLGLAATQRLLQLGAYVAVIDLQIPQESADFHPDQCHFYKADVSSPTEVNAAAAEIIRWSKSTELDIAAIVCCAGWLGPKKILSKDGSPIEIEHFKKVLDINLTGTIDTIRNLLPHVANQKTDSEGERGVIFTVSSAAAFDGQPGQVAYSAAKGAISALTLPMARDLAPLGIRCVCIAPGMFNTGMVAGMPEKALQSLKRVFEFPARAGKPSEFAAMVQHVVENVMLNGTVIRLDGATRMPSRM